MRPSPALRAAVSAAFACGLAGGALYGLAATALDAYLLPEIAGVGPIQTALAHAAAAGCAGWTAAALLLGPARGRNRRQAERERTAAMLALPALLSGLVLAGAPLGPDAYLVAAVAGWIAGLAAAPMRAAPLRS